MQEWRKYKLLYKNNNNKQEMTRAASLQSKKKGGRGTMTGGERDPPVVTGFQRALPVKGDGTKITGRDEQEALHVVCRMRGTDREGLGRRAQDNALEARWVPMLLPQGEGIRERENTDIVLGHVIAPKAEKEASIRGDPDPIPENVQGAGMDPGLGLSPIPDPEADRERGASIITSLNIVTLNYCSRLQL